MATEFTFANWVPQEIRQQARELGMVPSSENSESNYPLSAKILTARDFGIAQSGQAFFRQFKRQENWEGRFIEFLLELSHLPLPTQSSQLTPAEAQSFVTEAIEGARRLATHIERHQALFYRESLSVLPPIDGRKNHSDLSVVSILRAFAQSTEQDLAFSSDEKGGPRMGRNDGTNAELNDYLRSFSVIAQRNFGDTYHSFCCCLVSVVLDTDIPPSTYRSHALNITD